MSKFFKILKNIIPWVLLFAVLGAIVYGFVFYRPMSAKAKYISVQGECLGSAIKDRTAVTLSVRVLDSNPGASMARAQSTADALAEFAKRQEDSTLQIQTTRFDAYEKTEWSRTEEKSIVLGTETTISMEISSQSKSTIEYILSNLSGYENVYPENLRMYTSAEKMMPALEECLEDAVKNARQKASAIASADGLEVGRMTSAEYGRVAGSNDGGYQPVMARGIAMDAKASNFGLFAKDTEISVTVSATFELK